MKEKVCLLRPRKQQQGYPNDTSKKDLAQKWMGKDKRRFKNEKMWFKNEKKVRERGDDLIWETHSLVTRKSCLVMKDYSSGLFQ